MGDRWPACRPIRDTEGSGLAGGLSTEPVGAAWGRSKPVSLEVVDKIALATLHVGKGYPERKKKKSGGGPGDTYVKEPHLENL